MHKEQPNAQGNAPVPLILGKSTQIAALAEQIERVAVTSARVLVVGESGSGKELVARSIHARSARAAEQIVAINCGAIAASLIEETEEAALAEILFKFGEEPRSRPIAAALRRVGYDGWLSIEMRRTDNPLDHIRRAVDIAMTCYG